MTLKAILEPLVLFDNFGWTNEIGALLPDVHKNWRIIWKNQINNKYYQSAIEA